MGAGIRCGSCADVSVFGVHYDAHSRCFRSLPSRRVRCQSDEAVCFEVSRLELHEPDISLDGVEDGCRFVQEQICCCGPCRRDAPPSHRRSRDYGARPVSRAGMHRGRGSAIRRCRRKADTGSHHQDGSASGHGVSHSLKRYLVVARAALPPGKAGDARIDRPA